MEQYMKYKEAHHVFFKKMPAAAPKLQK